MGEVVDESSSHLIASDVAAIVTYLRTVPIERSPDLPAPKMQPAAEAFADEQSANAYGRAVYEGACAGCHGWSGISPVLPIATLTGTRAINDPGAGNVAQVILRGGQRHTSDESAYMPTFGSTYSDREIASVANFVTERFGAKGSALTPNDIVKLRAAE
jgi:mono/diheme cytochrome c family protein